MILNLLANNIFIRFSHWYPYHFAYFKSIDWAAWPLFSGAHILLSPLNYAVCVCVTTYTLTNVLICMVSKIIYIVFCWLGENVIQCSGYGFFLCTDEGQCKYFNIVCFVHITINIDTAKVWPMRNESLYDSIMLFVLRKCVHVIPKRESTECVCILKIWALSLSALDTLAHMCFDAFTDSNAPKRNVY